MKANTTLKIVVICAICAATMMAGCLEVDERVIIEEELSNVTSTPWQVITPTPIPVREIVTTTEPEPLPETKPEILFRSLIDNNVANISDDTSMIVLNNFSLCSSMAIEQAEWIRTNTEYDAGITIMWEEDHKKWEWAWISLIHTWVIIDDDLYVYDSVERNFWTEEDHAFSFDRAATIQHVSISKAKEYIKQDIERGRPNTTMYKIPSVFW